MKFFKRTFYLLITLISVGILISSCEKEFINEDISQFKISESDVSKESIGNDIEEPNSTLLRARCCNVMSINNLAGGLNRFSAIIKHRPNTTLQFIVYKYISGGSYSIGELSQELDYFACAGVNHIISLDSFVNEPIVNGEEYFLVVNIQRPNCYSFNTIDFIGEADYINNCPPDTYQDSDGNCVPIIISPD